MVVDTAEFGFVTLSFNTTALQVTALSPVPRVLELELSIDL
jgi:hypothetical protein